MASGRLNDPETKANGMTINVGSGGHCKLKFTPETLESIFSPGTNESNWFGMKYGFLLLDTKEDEAVALDEWLCPAPYMAALAAEAGLDLTEHLNFHQFYQKYHKHLGADQSGGTLYNMRVMGFDGSISKDELDISQLYCTMKFEKIRDSAFSDAEFPADNTQGKGDEMEVESESAPAAGVQVELTPLEMMRGLSMLKKKGFDVNKMDLSEQTAKIIELRNDVI